jgi:hypothetical protein
MTGETPHNPPFPYAKGGGCMDFIMFFIYIYIFIYTYIIYFLYIYIYTYI